MNNLDIKKKVQKLSTVEDEIKEVNETLKVLKAEKIAIEVELIEALEDNGGMGCHWEDLGVRVGLKTMIVPSVKDWEATLAFILENDLTYLLTHKVKSDGWRELRAMGVEVDGVTPFEKVTLSKTKYSK